MIISISDASNVTNDSTATTNLYQSTC